jgi:hypothetical protein
MAVNKIETVDIVRDLVTLLVTELTGSGAWVDNTDGTFTMPICKTYWLKAQDTITVDSIEYEVTEVIKDTSVTVTAASVPTLLTFFLDDPSFYHGTIVQTNQELSQGAKDVEERTPMAYLYRDIEDSFNSDDNLLDRETPIRLFFLHDTNFQDYTTEKTDEETLAPMRSMAYFFVEEILKKSKQLGRIDDYSVRDYLRFGVENSSGYTENIFNDNFSGVELNITLPVKASYVCECDDVRAKIKYIDSDLVLKSSNYGQTIVCTPTGSGAINVSNSNDTYSVNTSTDLELPDITHTDSDLSPLTLPAQTPMVCIPLQRGAEPLFSGQLISYQTGDAADIQDGYSVGDFYTILRNNPFANTSRFTELDGTAIAKGNTITTDYIIDWSTADYENEIVYVWNKAYFANQTWATQIANMLIDPTGGSFPTGWHTPSDKIAFNTVDRSLDSLPSFFNSPTGDFWTGNSAGTNTLNGIYCWLGASIRPRAKTNSEGGRQIRKYTFAELGV